MVMKKKIKRIKKNKKIKFNLLSKIINKSFLLLTALFILKIFLFFFYFISGYQLFTTATIRLILRVIISNDILLFFISIISIIELFYNKSRKHKIIIFFLLILNIIFIIFTFSFSIMVLVISE